MMTNEELDRLESLEVNTQNTREIVAGLHKVSVHLAKIEARQDIRIKQMDARIKHESRKSLKP